MAYFDELDDNFFYGLPTICLGNEESTLVDYRNPIAHDLLTGLDEDDFSILGEGSEETTVSALRNFLGNFYITQQAATGAVAITYHAKDEITRVCDSVKFAAIISITRTMLNKGYTLSAPHDEDISICAYHYGFSMQFSPIK